MVFLEYPADGAPPDRYNRWWAAYTGGGSVYLPLVMVDSGNQISNGYLDFYNVYKPMVDTALARAARAEITSYVLRCGNKLRFFTRVTNHSAVSLSYSGNYAAVHAIVYEDAHVGDTSRYVRSAVSTNVTSVLGDGSSGVFTLETPELQGVNWDKLHFIALADYRPAGATGPYDVLQAARAPRTDILRQDFDADGMNELAVLRPSEGVWFMLPSTSPGSYTSTQWGVSSDVPASGDYDGDGRTDIAVWRPDSGVWYVLPSSAPGTYINLQWGVSTDIAVPGDYDGDGKTDYAVWRPSPGQWYIIPSTAPATFIATQWGLTTDVPVPADYDGDGKTDIAVWRPSTGIWYVLPSSAAGTYTAQQWGVSTDKPVPADYDGDSKADIAVWRQGTGVWYILPSGSPGTHTSTQWGISIDTPVPGDYDGDGKADIAVWRSTSGIWYILPSAAPGTYSATQWGMEGDLPLSPVTRVLGSMP